LPPKAATLATNVKNEAFQKAKDIKISINRRRVRSIALAVITFSDGKNVLIFYNNSLVKILLDSGFREKGN
jgi:hypothetical protein